MAKNKRHLASQRNIPPAPEPLYVDESGTSTEVATGTQTSGALGHNPINFEEIRNKATEARANIAQTIADLEAWRAEIDATIAFLKASRS